MLGLFHHLTNKSKSSTGWIFGWHPSRHTKKPYKRLRRCIRDFAKLRDEELSVLTNCPQDCLETAYGWDLIAKNFDGGGYSCFFRRHRNKTLNYTSNPKTLWTRNDYYQCSWFHRLSSTSWFRQIHFDPNNHRHSTKPQKAPARIFACVASNHRLRNPDINTSSTDVNCCWHERCICSNHRSKNAKEDCKCFRFFDKNQKKTPTVLKY